MMQLTAPFLDVCELRALMAYKWDRNELVNDLFLVF